MRTKVRTASFTASMRVRPVVTVLVTRPWPEPISSCMLDDKSMTRTMSRPRDERSVCEYGITGCISARLVNAAAIARIANGARRKTEAR